MLLQRIICPFLIGLLTLLLIAVRGSNAKAVEDHEVAAVPVSNATRTHRPVMYTFFERIPMEQRFTGMTDSDDDALLEFWKEQWSDAGWEPRVLSLENAEQHAEYSNLKSKLDDIKMDELSRIYILRWIAMATIGGFWCDYDVFPLMDFRSDTQPLPNNGEMTVYAKGGAPTLASGSAEAWIKMARFLVEDAVQHRNPNRNKLTYWSDVLGMYNAVRSKNVTVHVRKSVLGINKALTEKPLTADRCGERPYRGQRVVHVDFAGILTAAIRPDLRLPKHRVTVAREWLPLWKQICIERVSEG
jgi:hypothetical protein